MKRIIYVLFIGLNSLQGCTQQKLGGKPNEHPFIVRDAYKTARKMDNLRSFLVSRNNKLISEEYFDSYSTDSLDHVRSITKNVMATLIGIAVDKGIIGSLDEPISKYLKVAVGKEKISIKHLLTMTSGISWNEGANAEGYSAWARSPDELKYVLDKPMLSEPGTAWNYNSGAIHILSAVLTNASGMNTLKFANKHLFEPLGISHLKWERQSDGYYNGAAGLELRPRDMIKFGQLYLDKGMFAGNQIVSEDFINEAISHHQPKNMKLDKNAGYGYCWWLDKFKEKEIYVAIGYGGQILALLPELSTIVVVTHNWRVDGQRSYEQRRQGINTLVAQVLDGILEEGTLSKN